MYLTTAPPYVVLRQAQEGEGVRTQVTRLPVEPKLRRTSSKVSFQMFPIETSTGIDQAHLMHPEDLSREEEITENRDSRT